MKLIQKLYHIFYFETTTTTTKKERETISYINLKFNKSGLFDCDTVKKNPTNDEIKLVYI